MQAMDVKCDCVLVSNIYKKSNLHYLTCAINLNKRKREREFPTCAPRDENGCLNIINPNLKKSTEDILYHIALDTKQYDFKQIFGDVKFVCMGGTAQRMEELAILAAKDLGIETASGGGFVDMAAASHRYCLYKVGPILSHGVGMSSMSVVLQEIIKLLQHAKAKDPIIFRIGTSGGIGVKEGSVVISNKAYNGMLQQTYNLAILGKQTSWPAIMDNCLAEELLEMSKDDDDFSTITGGTMGANEFYNGQGRTDGAFCDYTENDKFIFLNELQNKGIKNVEMEAPCLAAFTYKAGIKAADVCVTIIDRLHGDQVTTPKNVILEYQKRPMYIIFRYMRKYLESIGRFPYGKC